MDNLEATIIKTANGEVSVTDILSATANIEAAGELFANEFLSENPDMKEKLLSDMKIVREVVSTFASERVLKIK